MILLIAGPIAVGKTKLALGLRDRGTARLIRVREALASVTGIAVDDRRQLQLEGASLDKRTNGRWLLNYVLENVTGSESVVVDALRTKRQTLPLLTALSPIFLLYLDATPATRAARYARAAASDSLKQGVSFTEAMRHPTESAVRELVPLADLVLPTDDLDEEQVVEEVTRATQGLNQAT